MREYRRVPALESGAKLSNPDLQDIGEKNYTDIILRYGNLTTKFPQLDTNAKTIVAAINELYAHPGGSIVIPNPPVGSGLETEEGDIIETESGEPIEPEQGGGGGHVVGPLYSISIDGDIYTVEGSGGTTVVANPSESATYLLNSLQVEDTVYSVQGFEFITVLQANQTTITITNSKISTTSTFNVYTDIYGVVLEDISVSNHTLTLIFGKQSVDIRVKVRVT
jgi:hypothetical protein